MPRQESNDPQTDQPVRLPQNILRSANSQRQPTPQPSRQREPRFTVARRTDNELILFDDGASESWIVYPPRSGYEFLAVRRRSLASTIVEHHPWTAAVEPVDHVLDARDGCLVHGLHCQAQAAIMAAVRVGYDPFA